MYHVYITTSKQRKLSSIYEYSDNSFVISIHKEKPRKFNISRTSQYNLYLRNSRLANTLCKHSVGNFFESGNVCTGNEVVFYTALAVVDAEGKAESLLSATHVKLRALSEDTIRAYVEREMPLDCAGAAKIEKLGIALMESVSSDDPTSLIGLPLMKLTTLLARAGVEVLPGIR